MKFAVLLCCFLFLGQVPAQVDTANESKSSEKMVEELRVRFQMLHLTENRLLWEKKLYNLAESHIEHAGLLGLSKNEVKVARRELLESRKPLMKGQTRDAYRKFLTSEGFGRAMKSAKGSFDRKHALLVRELEGAIAASLKDGLPSESREGMTLLIQVDPDNKRFASGKGARTWRHLSMKDKLENHLNRLSLGAQTFGPELKLSDLHGKVVVWRSRSL